MTEQVLKDWLSDFKGLSPAELHSFANSTSQNQEIIQSIFTALEEKKYHAEFLENVCEQLFSFYRSPEESLHTFSLQFLPSLIAIYLNACAKGKQKSYGHIETLLLGFYNLEVLDKDGKALTWSFRIPSTSKPSIYHQPFGSPHLALTENALNRLEFGDNRSVNLGPYSEVEKITACNRLHVMKVLLQTYNRHISSVSKLSHQALCRTASRMVRQGTARQRSSMAIDSGGSFPVHPINYSHPRIPLNADFLLEILYSVYYSMFNGVSFPGGQTLEDIHYRAMLDLMPEVILVTNAISNSLKTNPSGQPADGPMGISLALSPTSSVSSFVTATTSTTNAIVKTIITNASFRTKKLPDDIPIQCIKDDSTDNNKAQLSSISEEGGEPHPEKPGKSGKSGSISSSVNKLPVVLQLRKNKDKKKEASHPHEGINGGNKTGLKSSLKSGLSNVGGSRHSPTESASDLSERLSETASVSRTGSIHEINSFQDTTGNPNMTKKSNSAFNVSSLSGNVSATGGMSLGTSQESVAGLKKGDSQEMGGLAKYPSAQTVV